MSGVLAALAQELGTDPESLRDALFAGDESLQPTYLTVNAAGQVTAVFTGHVQAGGLDIIADDAATVNKPDRKIRWHQTSYDGTVVAEIVSASLPGVPSVNSLLSRALTAGLARANNQQMALDDIDGIPSALLQEGVDVSTGRAAIIYQVISGAGVSTQGNIIDSDGLSNFHQIYARNNMGLVPPIWTNLGAGFAVAQIAGTRKNIASADGWIHLGGSVVGNGGGTFIDNSNNYGFRGPSGAMRFLCDSSVGTVVVQVNADGSINYATGGAVARLDLSGISWIAN